MACWRKTNFELFVADSRLQPSRLQPCLVSEVEPQRRDMNKSKHDAFASAFCNPVAQRSGSPCGLCLKFYVVRVCVRLGSKLPEACKRSICRRGPRLAGAFLQGTASVRCTSVRTRAPGVCARYCSQRCLYCARGPKIIGLSLVSRLEGRPGEELGARCVTVTGGG